MRIARRHILAFLLMAGACSPIGCSEETAGPDENPVAVPGKHLWSKSFSGENFQAPEAIAVDGSGNVILAGYFIGTVDFGGGLLVSGGWSTEEIFVAKFDADGAHLWSKRFGDDNNQNARAVAVDAAGNVVVTGGFGGTVDFGDGPLTSAGGSDIFIAKFGPDGAHRWSKRFGDADFHQYALSAAVDAAGNIVIMGDFFGTVDFGGGVLTSAGSRDIFIAKFGPDGAHLWSKRFGDGDAQLAAAVAADASGSLVLTGNFQGAVDFGGGALTSAGGRDIFAAMLGPDGAHLWSKRFGGGSGAHTAEAVAVDASGNVIVTGEFGGTIDFGGGVLTSEGLENVFLAKFGPDGGHLWSKRFGHSNFCEAHAVAVDYSENVIITGHFQQTVDFGGQVLATAGYEDIFLAKFEPGGGHLWSKRFGDENYQYAQSVAVFPSGNVIITGYFDGTVDFGGRAIKSEGDDIFVAKFRK